MQLFVILVFFIAMAGVVLLVGWYFQQQRQQMWEGVAARYGLRYSPHDPNDIPSRFDHFAIFQRGRRRRASNCLEGDYRGRHVLVFDYRYTTGSGKSKNTRRLSALMFHVDIRCPYLMIRPESFFDKIGDFLGFDDIDFEYEQFNRRFRVKGDKRFAYDICHSKMMDYLLANERLTWEMSGDRLVLYGLGTFDEREIAYCLDAAEGFFDLIPEYLRQG